MLNKSSLCGAVAYEAGAQSPAKQEGL